jgi:hypothetical protein
MVAAAATATPVMHVSVTVDEPVVAAKLPPSPRVLDSLPSQMSASDHVNYYNSVLYVHATPDNNNIHGDEIKQSQSDIKEVTPKIVSDSEPPLAPSSLSLASSSIAATTREHAHPLVCQ